MNRIDNPPGLGKEFKKAPRIFGAARGTEPTPPLAPVLECWAEAGARALSAFIADERRSPVLVEIKAIIAKFLSHAGPLSVKDGEALTRALHRLLSSGELPHVQQRAIRAAAEVIFHHYPNSSNASPS